MSKIISNDNKKELHLKNIIYPSSLTKKKLNIQNIISESKRIVTLSNNQTNLNNISNYLNQNKIIKKLYHNNYSNRKIKSAHSSNKKSKSIKKKITQNLVSLYSSLTHYSKNISNINNNESFNKNKKPSSVDKNLRNRNFYEMFTSNNISSNNNKFLKQNYNVSTTQRNKFKSIIKKQLIKKNKKRNIFTPRNNISSEDCSSNSFNINIYYNDFFKRVNKSETKNKKNKIEKSIQLQTKFSTSQSTLNKNKTKSNSNSCNNENDSINFKNIECPEELHFYFVCIYQNRKDIEKKFEIN